ncbi:hypothetical protein [Pseudomonas fulva]|uniref:hypothetical protein n=1 Tax=Pseudomonas fulva TaxID=47880 RepID=UPI000F7A9D8C|nr:hypothetical protein [Pseudomonas fulva]MBA1209385.1 hypothetical protein [Pseudomonas fulva]MBA1217773.1 hypothetical protein [Pseudomonas fulva]MDH0573253.1 hypothetical protein [Pseudomonas fulva]
MIEAALMGGALPGPWSAWEFIGSTSLLASGSATVEAKFPAGAEPGDLVVAIVSPLNENIQTTMSAKGWQHWVGGIQDYVCTARFVEGLSPPAYARAGSNSIFVSVLVFRSQGWSSVKLEAHLAPASPVNVTTQLQNVLLLAIGTTPRTTRGWAVAMTGAEPTVRVERTLAPALQAYSANIDFPHEISGIVVDALSGAERNLILTVS